MDIFGSQSFKSYYHVIIIGSSPFWNLLIFSPSLVCLMPKRPFFNRPVLRFKSWRGRETAIFLLRHAIEKGVKLHPDGGYQRSLYVSTVLMSLLYKYHLGTHWYLVLTKRNLSIWLCLRNWEVCLWQRNLSYLVHWTISLLKFRNICV